MIKIAVAVLLFLVLVTAQAAPPAGKWSGAAAEHLAYGKVNHNLAMQLTVNGTVVTGFITINSKTHPIQNGQFKDGHFSFSTNVGNALLTGALTYHADSMGEHLTGRITSDKGDSRDVELRR